jgi:hypothetical protein
VGPSFLIGPDPPDRLTTTVTTGAFAFTDGELRGTGLVGCYEAAGRIVVAVISVLRVDRRKDSECVFDGLGAAERGRSSRHRSA